MEERKLAERWYDAEVGHSEPPEISLGGLSRLRRLSASAERSERTPSQDRMATSRFVRGCLVPPFDGAFLMGAPRQFICQES
jgi:hypothetical protein